jgi:flagellar protein FlaG
MALDGIASVKGVAPAVPDSRRETPQPESDDAAAAKSDAPRVAAAPAPPDLSHAIEKLTHALQAAQSNLSFSVDEVTGKTIVRVVRSSTGELVRQIPSEESLAIAASLAPDEPMSSLGIDRWS